MCVLKSWFSSICCGQNRTRDIKSGIVIKNETLKRVKIKTMSEQSIVEPMTEIIFPVMKNETMSFHCCKDKLDRRIIHSTYVRAPNNSKNHIVLYLIPRCQEFEETSIYFWHIKVVTKSNNKFINWIRTLFCRNGYQRA